MTEPSGKKRNSGLITQQLAKMREKLASIGEKERVLRERSASLEVYRYLLDAHRLASWPNAKATVLDIPPTGRGESNQLAA